MRRTSVKLFSDHFCKSIFDRLLLSRGFMTYILPCAKLWWIIFKQLKIHVHSDSLMIKTSLKQRPQRLPFCTLVWLNQRKLIGKWVWITTEILIQKDRQKLRISIITLLRAFSDSSSANDFISIDFWLLHFWFKYKCTFIYSHTFLWQKSARWNRQNLADTVHGVICFAWRTH